MQGWTPAGGHRFGGLTAEVAGRTAAAGAIVVPVCLCPDVPLARRS
ncbi:hypothetical protein ACFVWG_26655 [Kribbella sp. NPDC058245]